MASRREALLSRVAALPEELLPQIEQSVDEIVLWHEGVYRLSDEERSAVQKGMDAARRGDFAPDEDIAQLRNRSAG